jgi:catechol 2,3-dioxygenase-like lactoylglutathione lyase family enzyme
MEKTMTTNTLKVHVSLNVADVAKSIDFYRRLFNVEPVRVRADYAKFDLTNPPVNLALNQVPNLAKTTDHNSGALSHLGIQVATTEDVMAIRGEWIEKGLITRDEMETECCYAKQDKTWAFDPDGNEWEVFVVLGESEIKTTSQCCAPAAVETKAAPKEAAVCCAG